MRPGLFLLILLSVAMSACAQLLLKLGVGAASAGEAVGAEPGVAARGMAFLLSPWVIAGLALYGLGAVVWLFVLQKVPLSAAYPFVGMGFVFTMVLGVTALGETLTMGRIIGTLMIAAGCVTVARSIV